MVKNLMPLQGYGSSVVRIKKTGWPQIQLEVELCLIYIVWCKLRCSLTKNSVCRLRSSTWWLRCNLRCYNLFFFFFRFTTLCLQRRQYKLHAHEILEEMNIVQNLEIFTTFDLASLSLLYHGVSSVMSALHPLALCPSFLDFLHMIVLFILETL